MANRKSLADLQEIKAKTLGKIVLGEGSGEIRVVVGVATCGIAAGALPVMDAVVNGVKEENLADKVTVSQTGCIGICQYEPVMEVWEGGKERVTYVKMTAEKAKEVVEKHLKGGQVVAEYTIGAYQK